MTGQLAVPLHHVETVGDIAVLPPRRRCEACAASTSQTGPASFHRCFTGWLDPLPVVGQVVAHVEKCAKCGGRGDGAPLTTRCAVCRGSGWVRDQYARVRAVLPIIGPNDPTPKSGRWIRVESTGLLWLGEWIDNCLSSTRLPDLPGAVPGGVALIVEPASCANCGVHHLESACPLRLAQPVPVPALSAPYTESEE